jgi:hypothetical protein
MLDAVQALLTHLRAVREEARGLARVRFDDEGLERALLDAYHTLVDVTASLEDRVQS